MTSTLDVAMYYDKCILVNPIFSMAFLSQREAVHFGETQPIDLYTMPIPMFYGAHESHATSVGMRDEAFIGQMSFFPLRTAHGKIYIVNNAFQTWSDKEVKQK